MEKQEKISKKKYKRLLYKIYSDKLPKEFDGFKMCMISDLHDTCYNADNVSISFDIIFEKPDIVLIAGDLITGISNRDYNNQRLMLKFSSKAAPIYYGLGNHEVRKYDNVRKFMSVVEKIPNVHILDNKSARIERIAEDGSVKSITVAGLTLDEKYYYKKNRKTMLDKGCIEEKLGEKTSDYTIMLAHHPDYFESYVEWGADLILSGHLHGGLVRLPLVGGLISPHLRLFPKYDRGEFKKDASTMIVSAGLGTHTVPRIFNPPELIYIELFSVEKK